MGSWSQKSLGRMTVETKLLRKHIMSWIHYDAWFTKWFDRFPFKAVEVHSPRATLEARGKSRVRKIVGFSRWRHKSHGHLGKHLIHPHPRITLCRKLNSCTRVHWKARRRKRVKRIEKKIKKERKKEWRDVKRKGVEREEYGKSVVEKLRKMLSVKLSSWAFFRLRKGPSDPLLTHWSPNHCLISLARGFLREFTSLAWAWRYHDMNMYWYFLSK